MAYGTLENRAVPDDPATATQHSAVAASSCPLARASCYGTHPARHRGGNAFAPSPFQLRQARLPDRFGAISLRPSLASVPVRALVRPVPGAAARISIWDDTGPRVGR